MTVLSTGSSFDEEINTLRSSWEQFDFFFVHYKPADAAGEDGDFERKVAQLEAFDATLPEVLALNPDVLMIAGDHSTPARASGHSWHPVPFLLRSQWTRHDDVRSFDELSCLSGALGVMPATDVMPLAMANARRFTKYGA
jgi:2,3-bisphosphoglycerate-independent phosphoglycerate mutase